MNCFHAAWMNPSEVGWLVVTLPESVVIKRIKVYTGRNPSAYLYRAEIRVGESVDTSDPT